MSGLRAPRAGSARDQQVKIENAFDPEEAVKCLVWIREVTGEPIPVESVMDNKHKVADFFYKTLKDGFLLTRLVNAIVPDDIKINTHSMTFKKSNNEAFESARERSRIEIFCQKIQEYGVPPDYAFQTDSLYERTNLPQVCASIRNFGIEEPASNMKVLILLFAVGIAYAMAAPQKRLILDDLASETGKILVCEGKMTEEACRECCHNTTWYITAEENACSAACNLLPDAADYITTPLPA